jgi:cell wall-associated NlpC family hydrolase
MPRLSAEQIYAFARSAGFSPDQSATMTAIAFAESGGDPRAHNPVGEDSRGLWQINVRAHPDLAARYDLYDPRQNALAAYEVSSHGHNVDPWTTTHGGSSAKYLHYRTEAQAAAVAYGDGPNRGVWTGTSGYGDPLSAGPGGGSPAHAVDPLPGAEPAIGQVDAGNTSAAEFLRAALAQRGDRYIYGAETSLHDPNPTAFDCSELTQWAAAQAGITIPDGAAYQYLWAKEHGYLVPVSEARQVPGALLFEFSSEPRPGGGRPSEAHVAISLGRHKTIEARGTSYGVNEFSSDNRGFNYAAVIPGLASTDVDPSTLGDLTASASLGTVSPTDDSDFDGIDNATEISLGLDPYSPDTDKDTLSDKYELTVSHTDPRLADSDGDGVPDAFEIAHGTNPMLPDAPSGSSLDGAMAVVATSDPTLDIDLDGLDSNLEQMLHTNPNVADSDLDGFSDGLEYNSGSDPLSAHSTPLHPGDHAHPLDDPLADDSVDGH